MTKKNPVSGPCLEMKSASAIEDQSDTRTGTNERRWGGCDCLFGFEMLDIKDIAGRETQNAEKPTEFNPVGLETCSKLSCVFWCIVYSPEGAGFESISQD